MAGKAKHGMSHTRLYQCWCSMKQRCNYKSGISYHRYGGRGITYYDEWNNFEPFMIWALQNGYKDDLTLDRIDNNGNYEPSNCRWATQHEQSMNKTHLSNSTGFVGVRPHYRKTSNGQKQLDGYSAYVFRFGKEKYVGHALTAEDAAKIRNEYIRKNEYGNSN